jgi:hypothetical protein
MSAERKFAEVTAALSNARDVSVGGGKGFGSGALKVRGKIFALLDSKMQIVLKLPKSRVDELVASGGGSRFEPRRGKAMKEWLVVGNEYHSVMELAKEACAFVRSGRK